MNRTPIVPPASAEPVSPALAIFDLDGTLLRGDSFLPFLVSYGLKRRRLGALLALPAFVGLYVVRVMSDRRAKERLLGAFFSGEPMEAIDAHARWFCEHWVGRKLRQGVVERLRRHQSAGDRVILLSASPDLYVRAIGESLGISEVIATRVAADGNFCRGTIVGDNCKGPHKVTMLLAHLGVEEMPGGASSYGDSASDLPLLRRVQHGYLVRGDRVELVAPAEAGVGCQG